VSELKTYREAAPGQVVLHSTQPAEIARALKAAGVRFEQWVPAAQLEPGDAPERVLSAFQKDIDRLVQEEGYQAVDVVSLNRTAPNKVELRQKFLSEHTHREDEVRFFVAGSGLFTLHIGTEVFEVLCEKGDLISVPANTPHWFDMGPNPDFIAIRFFNNPEGWVAHYTGSRIADAFSRLDN